MGLFDDIVGGVGKVIQKPQSVATSLINEIGGTADDQRDFIRRYEYGLVEDTEENSDRYEAAKAMVGDSEGGGKGSPFGLGNIGSAVTQGVEGNVRPSDILNFANEGDQSTLNSVLNPVADIAIDPLMFTGGLAAKAPGTAGQLARSAGTFGKLGEGAGKADKAAQAARYLYQGALAGGGNPMVGLGTSALMPIAERGIGRIAGRVISRAGTDIADDLVGQGAESALSKQGIDELEETLSSPEIRLIMGLDDLPQGATSRNLPVPFEGEDNVINEARAYLAGNPDADVYDMMFDVPGVRARDRDRIFSQATRPSDARELPLFDRVTRLNEQMMAPLPAKRPEQLALNAAPEPIALGTEAPSTLNDRAALQEMLAQVPTGSGTWPVELFGPKPKMLNAGRPAPVAPSIEGIERMELPGPATPVSLSPNQPKAITGPTPIEQAVKASVDPTRSVRIPGNIDPEIVEQLKQFPEQTVNRILRDARNIARGKKMPYEQVLQNVIDIMGPPGDDPLLAVLQKAIRG